MPVLENFGFRVLKETPTRLDGRRRRGPYPRIRRRDLPTARPAAPILTRAEVIEAVVAAVLEGRVARTTCSTSCSSRAGSTRDGVVLFRAWFRYLRQTGLSYGLATVVEALRRAPDVTRGLIALFEAMHDPAAKGRDDAVAAAQKTGSTRA